MAPNAPKAQYFALPPRPTTRPRGRHGIHHIKMLPVECRFLRRFRTEGNPYCETIQRILDSHEKETVASCQAYLDDYRGKGRPRYAVDLDRIIGMLENADVCQLPIRGILLPGTDSRPCRRPLWARSVLPTRRHMATRTDSCDRRIRPLGDREDKFVRRVSARRQVRTFRGQIMYASVFSRIANPPQDAPLREMRHLPPNVAPTARARARTRGTSAGIERAADGLTALAPEGASVTS